MEKYAKHMNALVFFALLLLGSFAVHAQGEGIDEIGAPAPAFAQLGSSARCAESNQRPCGDNCYCCVNGGRCPHCCFATLAQCSKAC
uniref:Meg domain-containing protein n=1 Tax=Setaria viridis TaxID=4556 RepID=A0A4U6VMA1_SETVI|nr:hypothetical protein SEVIR_2G065000v2 [Setaria viridis]